MVIVCEVPASACNLIASAPSSLAVITALPPSAHKSLASFHFNPIPPADEVTLIAPTPSAPSVVPSSFTIVIVCEVPASACNLIASAASSLAVITALPPSAHKSLASFHFNPRPPAVEVTLIAPAPSEPSVVPAVFKISIVWLVPAVACNLIAEPILPSADTNTPPADASRLIASAPVPCVFVNVILSVDAVFAVRATSPAVAIVNEEFFPVIATPPAVDVNSIDALSVPFVFTIRMSSFPAVAEAATLIYASRAVFPSVKSFSSATFIVIPPALVVSAIASLPVDVVSIVTPPVPASISNAVAPVELPIVIVLCAAPVPIFIFWATASLPILIVPPLEFIWIADVESKSKVVAPDSVVAPLPFIAIVAVPSVNVNAALAVVNVIVEPESIVAAPVTSISKIPASISTIEPAFASASICNATPAPCADIKLIWPSSEFVVNVISSAASIVTLSPAFKSKLPAVAVIEIASAAVPAVLVNEIFSFPVELWGENIISVAAFLPNLSVWPSAKLGAITILPTVASIEIASLPVPSEDNNNDESPPPVTESVKSLALLPPVVTVIFAASVPSIDIVEPSKVNAPELISSAPVVVISISAELPWIFTPPLPSSVNAPEDVVKLLAPAASKLIVPVVSIVIPPVPASISNAVAPVALPNAIVLWAAPVPIFIFWATASLPILITPADELIESAPVESSSSVVAPDIVVAPVPPICIVAVPSVIVIAFTDVNVIAAVASIVTPAPFKSKAPVVVISISAALPWIFTPPLPSSVNAPEDVVILEAAPASKLIPFVASIVTSIPAFKSKLPAVAVIAIASELFPAVLTNEIFSLPAVPWGENIISVALFLPNFNVCPSANVEPKLIEPVEVSTVTSPLVSTSSVVTPDNVVAPLPFIANVAAPSVNVNAAFAVVNVMVEPESIVAAPVTSISKIPASISTIEPALASASICNATPAPCADTKLIWPSSEVVVNAISSAASIVTLSPAFKSKLPAVAVIEIASAAVPDVLVKEIFSLPAVPWGENTISVAPFLPNFNVCPSVKIAPIVIELETESIDTAPVASTSKPFEPLCLIIISLSTPILIWEPSLFNETFAPNDAS